MSGMKKMLRTKVWLKSMDKDVKEFVKTCFGCQLVANLPAPLPLVSTPLPTTA